MRLVKWLVAACLMLGVGQAQAVLITLNQTKLLAGSQLEILVEAPSSQAEAPTLKLPASWQAHFKLIEKTHWVEARPRGDYMHRWSLVLQHLQADSISRQLSLAPLKVNGQNSQPLLLNLVAVRKKPTPSKQRIKQPLEMQQQVDFTDAYVGQTLVYELLIRYQGFPIEPRLSQLEVEGATARQLGEGREQGFKQQGVHIQEARWQELLQLHKTDVTIAPRFFSSRLVFTGQSTGQLYETQTPELKVKVRPIPASWPAEQPWLPALGVNLEAAFLPKPKQLKQDEPLELQIHLDVVGQQARNLPQFKSLVSDNWRIEPLIEELSDRVVDGLLVGSLKQRFLLYPRQAGRLQLPNLTLHWWDVSKHQAAKTQVNLGQLSVLPKGNLNPSAVNKLDSTIAEPMDKKIEAQTNKGWLGWLLIILGSLTVAAACFFALKGQQKSLDLPPLNPNQ
ncbi:BatD family protein [Marinospirillum insulare]|uniref:Oxygen tolerance n=1 Tax=Marinospirillum insulare TaxID=217169 RepID=A0ABQ6A0W5_9GAMM|nr:BatD family protein [Marinospirillum insulare]GLR64207.1 hypothetical protein GCM10007878_16450 [Marinospirillum insulare]